MSFKTKDNRKTLPVAMEYAAGSERFLEKEAA